MKRKLLLEYKVRKLEKLVNERVAKGKMPKYFYHGTSQDAVESILKNGLVSSKKAGRLVHSTFTNKDMVYLASSIGGAKMWGRSANLHNYAVIQVDSSYLDPEKLSGDVNQLRDVVSDDADPDTDPDFQEMFNLDFSNGRYQCGDFTYSGDIPAAACTVIFRSDPNKSYSLRKMSDEGDIDSAIKLWDTYISDTSSGESYEGVFLCTCLHYASSKETNTPFNWKSDKLRSLVLNKIPVRILNHEFHNYKDTTILRSLLDNCSDDIAEIMYALANKYGDKLSDTNIELLWGLFTKPRQRNKLDIIASLPDKYLKIGKPFMTKNFQKQLGI